MKQFQPGDKVKWSSHNAEPGKGLRVSQVSGVVCDTCADGAVRVRVNGAGPKLKLAASRLTKEGQS